MKKLRVKIIFLLCLPVFYLLITTTCNRTPVFAAENITVLPQLTQLDLTTDKPEAQIYYKNNTSLPVELTLSVEDVRELEDRNPVGILDPKEAINYKYSLSSWVYLDRQTLLLNPGEMNSINATVNKDKLTPGGHYGTILAEIHQSSNDKKALKVKGVLASLLFVRASTGSERELAKIPYFGTEGTTFNFPTKYIFRFQNMGNVDLTPYGLVEIVDSRGRVVAKGIVNEDSLITLPEAIRKYEVSVKPLQKIILPGRYRANLTLHYGKSKKEIKISTTITTQGTVNVAGLLLALAVFLGALETGRRILKSTAKHQT
jgi:hypothetical protein